MSNTRTSNSIKNSITVIVRYFIITLMGFLSQSIFIRTLGVEYNGIKGLFGNILDMLNIAELGFGTAIIYHLYKPMAEENIQEVRTLIKYYRNIYRIIAAVIFTAGIIILPMIPKIVGDVSIPENVCFLFFLYLMGTVSSYLLTYKRSILYADQKNYITKIVNSVFVLLRNVIQIMIIVFTKKFTLYLLSQILFSILENISINIIVNKKYKYVKDLSKVEDISKELKQDIKKKVKGLVFHTFAGFIVLGTDNIIISMTNGLGVVVVGMYANYNMVINQIKSLFENIIGSVTASVGNLLTKEDKAKSRSIYKSIFLINSWLFCFTTISIYCMIEPFIKIWIGGNYLLSKYVLLTLVTNLYIQGIRRTSETFLDAGGICYENRFVALLEAIINLVASLIFVKIFGLAGVFLGTITSTMILFFYSYPKYAYKLVLNGTYKEYFQLLFKHVLITIIICAITNWISNFINVSNAWAELILNGILCVTLPNILYLLFAIRMPEFDFYRNKLEALKRK